MNWNCGTCTFQNHPDLSTCEMCGTLKQSPIKTVVSSNDSINKIPSFKKCMECTFDNSVDALSCEICGNKFKYNDVAAKSEDTKTEKSMNSSLSSSNKVERYNSKVPETLPALGETFGGSYFNTISTRAPVLTREVSGTLSHECSLSSSNKVERHNSYDKVPETSQVKIGAAVKIVLKEDQPTGVLTTGKVRQILSKGNHPRGIKVMLESGLVGRVKKVIPSDHKQKEKCKGNLLKSDSNKFNHEISRTLNVEDEYNKIDRTKTLVDLLKDKNLMFELMNKENKAKIASKDKESIKCGCMATIHSFSTSCFNCGRIQCEQEGKY